MEECVGIDGKILSEVILPIMNVSRTAMDGQMHPEEPLNKSQLYVTTAGYKNTFPYEKLIQVLIWQIVTGDKAFVLGGTYRIPVLVKLLDKDFVKDLKMDGTFNEATFEREYESMWSGTSENSFFNYSLLEKARTLHTPEYEASGRSAKGSYYIVSCDVGRRECDTVAAIIKCTPQPQGISTKTLVNMFTYHNEHFEDQSIALKRLFYKYKARAIIVDGNGMGIGLVDYLVKPQYCADTDESFPDFGVINDTENEYRRFETDHCEQNAIYFMKANAAINTEAHTAVKLQIQSGHIKFLVDERIAKNKLLGTTKGQNMSPERRQDYLRPFTLTSILLEEMCNLREETEGVNIILKQSNKGIHKDKFSAFEYGIYYLKEFEDDVGKKRKKFSAKDWMFMN